ncbi:hypothetical protein [Cohnella hashimotonis]|uniref:Uncharacterized protein n=1 Tax=Cohnella hashimotonis TaxID=2826895 RepID=A0ABT6TNF0_9BACL|nr:hypothetical protein [Cohnella hashimotonis]MDI4647783.1 hypothetical protein [Cohnella hashimotonis]
MEFTSYRGRLEGVPIPFRSEMRFLMETSAGVPNRIGKRNEKPPVRAEPRAWTEAADPDGVSAELKRNGIRMFRTEAAAQYGTPIVRAERTWIVFAPHAFFIVDRIEAVKPVRTESTFLFGADGDRVAVKTAAETKLVIRSGGAGMKFFQVLSVSGDEANECRLSRGHDSERDPEAETGPQLCRYTSELYRCSHTVVYAAALDDTEAVRKWHIVLLAARHFYVEPPAKDGGCALELAEDEALIVSDRSAGKAYRIDRDGRLSVV